MSTLLMRILAPLQSWGSQSLLTDRDTGLEPTKSGLLGLVCAALGRPRHEALDDLIQLRLGIRVDRPGVKLKDFHIVQNVLEADGKGKKNIITNRAYLSNAAFLVGLEGDLVLLKAIHQALRHPVWPLFFGRKAFVPSQPVWMPDGLRENQNLKQALMDCGWLVGWPQDKTPQQVLCVWEDEQGNQMRNDVPISFAQRTFSTRLISTSLENAPITYREEVFR